MTVLKARATGDVRTLPLAPAIEPRRSIEPVVDPRIADLTAQLAAANAALAAVEEQAVVDIAAAREAGAAEARLDEERRVEKIGQGVTAAVTAWRERLDGLDRLAAVLAEAALAKMFDQHADLAELVGRTLAKRVAAIDSNAVVRVRVSARDFADDDALLALADRCGLPASSIVAQSDAPPGACEIDLAVGQLDLTIAGQWHAIERCLAAIASEEPA